TGMLKGFELAATVSKDDCELLQVLHANTSLEGSCKGLDAQMCHLLNSYRREQAMRQALFKKRGVVDPNKIKYDNEKVSSEEDHLEEHDGGCKTEQESDNNEESLPTTPKRQFRSSLQRSVQLAQSHDMCEKSRLQLPIEKLCVIRKKKHEAFHPGCLKQKVKFPASVMVWDSMSAEGIRKLQFIKGNADPNKYLQILDESRLPLMEKYLTSGQDFIFEQDGLACHISKESLKWLDDYSIPFLVWDSSSPDFLPIKTLWPGENILQEQSSS
ncbi:hypothetical protein ILUMI_19002, partial [Ignelater luminosus]